MVFILFIVSAFGWYIVGDVYDGCLAVLPGYLPSNTHRAMLVMGHLYDALRGVRHK